MNLLLFTIFTKVIGKLAFRIHYLRGTIPHSSSLFLLFSFSLFSVMSLLSLPHILHSTFPIYISFPWLTILHFMRVRRFFFPISLLFCLWFSSQCITNKYKKEHFLECRSLHGYYRFFFKLKVEIEHTATETLAS